MNAQSITLDKWKIRLGLLPVPLFEGHVDKFIMMNGISGNFCLDLSGEQHPEMRRDYAWSSDVGHYVNLYKDTVEVYRWDREASALNRYDRKSVEGQLDKFFEYLQKDQPARELSIIVFAIKVFRKLRAVLLRNGCADGESALNIFLCLMACAIDKQEPDNLDLARWEIIPDVLQKVRVVSSEDWQSLREELLSGLPQYFLKPDISLLLRHASGPLFQEAHYAAHIDNPGQMAIAGFLPETATINRVTESIGIHYTPSPLVRTLVEEALNALHELPPDSLVVFDPACGSGEFLKETARQTRLKGYEGSLKLTGWDDSRSAVNITRFVLAQETASCRNNVSYEIVQKDALAAVEQWPENVDVVLMNPHPFSLGRV